MNHPRVRDAISHGITFIASAQQADGGFASFSSPTQTPFESTLSYQATFGPATILSSLASLSQPAAMKVRKKLAAWLVDQRSANWSFNYWAASAPERTTLPYPDDLDDTFCTLMALHQHDPTITDEACLGKVVKILIAAEQQVGGPYRTWLVDTKAPAVWQDVDLAVNSNVAHFLSAVAEPLPKLTALMDQAIATHSFASPYYPSAYPVMYFVARAYRGAEGNKLARHVLKLKRGDWWDSPLQTALALLSLSRLGYAQDNDQAIDRLLQTQQSDGSWPAEAFCLDPSIDGKSYYSGSPALTTALILLALETHNAESALPAAQPKISNAATNTQYDRIIAEAANELQGLSTPLNRDSLAMLDKVKKHDKNYEIALLPDFFNQSLANPLRTSQRDTILSELGTANLYGWMAYTIYDDFLDDEGTPNMLPVANVALRYSLRHFDRALPHDTAFQQLTAQTFDDIDEANAWELAHCRAKVTATHITIGRLPSYARTLQLADRSLGHTLSPMGVLAASGIHPQDERAVLVHRALRHYLVARQLNDDLHDWEQDFRAGIITYVVVSILRELSPPRGPQPLSSLIADMQKQFWRHTLPTVCQTITNHTNLARKAATKSHLLTKQNIIISLTESIDQSVADTLAEQTKAIQFLTSYSEK